MSLVISPKLEKRYAGWIESTNFSDFVGSDAEISSSRQASRTIGATIGSTNSIIASQNRIVEGLDKAYLQRERVIASLEDIKAIFEWGLSDIIWTLEQQREVLIDILNVLQQPLDTQAKELRGRGENAFKNGWYDDALKEFKESEEKNRYDFTIHMFLGFIYLNHKKDITTALEYFEKAAKYAEPKSPYYSAYALLYVSWIYYLNEDYKKAYETSKKGLELYSTIYELHYRHAQYCSLVGNFDEAIEHLNISIVDGDRYFILRADAEKDFDKMKREMIMFFQNLRKETAFTAKKEIKKTENFIKESHSNNVPEEYLEKTIFHLNNAKTLYEGGSYLDYCDSIINSKYAQINSLKTLIQSLSEQKKAVIDSKEKISDKHEKIAQIFFLIGWILLAIFLLYLLLFSGNGIAMLFGTCLCIVAWYLGGAACGLIAEKIHKSKTKKKKLAINELDKKIESYKILYNSTNNI